MLLPSVFMYIINRNQRPSAYQHLQEQLLTLLRTSPTAGSDSVSIFILLLTRKLFSKLFICFSSFLLTSYKVQSPVYFPAYILVALSCTSISKMLHKPEKCISEVVTVFLLFISLRKSHGQKAKMVSTTHLFTNYWCGLLVADWRQIVELS